MTDKEIWDRIGEIQKEGGFIMPKHTQEQIKRRKRHTLNKKLQQAFVVVAVIVRRVYLQIQWKL